MLPKATAGTAVGVVAGEVRLVPTVVVLAAIFNLLPMPPGEGSRNRTVEVAVAAEEIPLIEVLLPFTVLELPPNPNPQLPPPPEFNFGMDDEDEGLVLKGTLAFDLVGLSKVVRLLVILLLLPLNILPFVAEEGGEFKDAIILPPLPLGGEGVDDKDDEVKLDPDKLIVILAFFMSRLGLFALFTTGGVEYKRFS